MASSDITADSIESGVEQLEALLSLRLPEGQTLDFTDPDQWEELEQLWKAELTREELIQLEALGIEEKTVRAFQAMHHPGMWRPTKHLAMTISGFLGTLGNFGGAQTYGSALFNSFDAANFLLASGFAGFTIQNSFDFVARWLGKREGAALPAHLQEILDQERPIEMELDSDEQSRLAQLGDFLEKNRYEVSKYVVLGSMVLTMFGHGAEVFLHDNPAAWNAAFGRALGMAGFALVVANNYLQKKEQDPDYEKDAIEKIFAQDLLVDGIDKIKGEKGTTHRAVGTIAMIGLTGGTLGAGGWGLMTSGETVFRQVLGGIIGVNWAAWSLPYNMADVDRNLANQELELLQGAFVQRIQPLMDDILQQNHVATAEQMVALATFVEDFAERLNKIQHRRHYRLDIEPAAKPRKLDVETIRAHIAEQLDEALGTDLKKYYLDIRVERSNMRLKCNSKEYDYVTALQPDAANILVGETRGAPNEVVLVYHDTVPTTVQAAMARLEALHDASDFAGQPLTIERTATQYIKLTPFELQAVVEMVQEAEHLASTSRMHAAMVTRDDDHTFDLLAKAYAGVSLSEQARNVVDIIQEGGVDDVPEALSAKPEPLLSLIPVGAAYEDAAMLDGATVASRLRHWALGG